MSNCKVRVTFSGPAENVRRAVESVVNIGWRYDPILGAEADEEKTLEYCWDYPDPFEFGDASVDLFSDDVTRVCVTLDVESTNPHHLFDWLLEEVSAEEGVTLNVREIVTKVPFNETIHLGKKDG